jgi:uncharacterized protein (TIGR02611 family)
MKRRPPGDGKDRNVTLDATGEDWRWRRKIRSSRPSRLIYRLVVAVIGLVIVVVGLIMVPFPGPGWLVVFIGLAVWASEFERAQGLLRLGRRTLEAWARWLIPQPWWIRGLLLLVTIATAAAVFWLLLAISGVPGYLPDQVQQWLEKVPGLRH